MNLTQLFRLGTAALVAWSPLAASAQADKYRPGDKIEYKDTSYSTVWEPGVYVGATPEGKQPIIRKKPNEYYKDGAQTATDWTMIRLPMSQPAAVAPPAAPTAKAAPAAPAPAKPPTRIAEVVSPVPANMRGGLVTQEEILQFLETRLGPNPFAHPDRERIKQELAAMVKARGVNFRYQPVSDFSNKLGKYGASSDVTFPVMSNYGPPTRRDWLTGKWTLSKIGATVDFERGDKVYRQTEIGVKDVGTLIVNGDGTYVWEIDVPRAVAKGTWRKATATEMGHLGGEAVVLLKAKGGRDWIVHQDRVTELKGDWVNIAELDARQIREGGFRVGKK